jgi:hypothetical protein
MLQRCAKALQGLQRRQALNEKMRSKYTTPNNKRVLRANCPSGEGAATANNGPNVTVL